MNAWHVWKGSGLEEIWRNMEEFTLEKYHMNAKHVTKGSIKQATWKNMKRLTYSRWRTMWVSNV